MCFCCGLALVQWEANEDPATEHRKHAPACSFARGAATDNVSVPGVVGKDPAKKTELEEVCVCPFVLLFCELKFCVISF